MEDDFGFNYKDWEYVYHPNQPFQNLFEVITPDQRPEPEFLYKYYSLTEYNIDALKNCYLYASCVFELNDPFDSMDEFISFRDLPLELLCAYDRVWEVTKKNIIDNHQKYRIELRHNLILTFYQKTGIISLSEDSVNQMLWAYYASAHHGFAIKFKVDSLKKVFSGPFPINYQKEWDSILIKNREEFGAGMLYLTSIKSNQWQHEKEWRFLASHPPMSIPRYFEDEEAKNNRKFHYSKEVIDEIVLGFKFRDRLVRMDDNNLLDFNGFSNKESFKFKKEILDYIIRENLKVSMIDLKNGSRNFELEQKPIKLLKIEENVYSFEILV